MESRIITTLGHVDHGKTTLMDALLAANNIISPRMAGKMRYLDSREDEQERGITMESSAVSLKFQVMERDPNGEKSPKTYTINMIDTPGHVDFSSEVSTASRLCDGALVLVDVVEGVCTQTISVLRQAWTDRLRPILIINKLDRLITELKLAPVEAQHHLSRLLEQVNAVMGSFFAEERMDDDFKWREEREKRVKEKKDMMADETEAHLNNEDEEEFQEKDDEDIYFAPERGNVVFASAIDGWGFRVSKFAQLYAAKLGIKESNLRRVLWGDYFLDPKTKRVISYKHLKGRPLKSLFVQFVLENIWAVYDAVDINPNPGKITKIISTLSLKVPPRDLKSKDTKNLLWIVMSQWLSLSTSIIQTVIDIVPPPSIAQKVRMPKILYPELTYEQIEKGKFEHKRQVEKDLVDGESGEKRMAVGYISKMFAVRRSELPENKKRKLTAEEMRAKAKEAREARAARANGEANPAGVDIPAPSESQSKPEEPAEDSSQPTETLLGFTRLYTGSLHLNQRIYAVLPKYSSHLPPTHPRNKPFVKRAKVEGLYVMMGRELVSVESVKAGMVFAVRGLEGKVGRSGTVCAMPMKEGEATEEDGEEEGVREGDEECLVNLGGINRQAAPIVRVALEPINPSDLGKLVEGLKLLSQSDPCVEAFQQQTGEWVILTAGELHLERCVKDLRERFAQVEISQSKPIVPFRETAIRVPDMAPTKSPTGTRGTMTGSSSSGVVQFTIRATPMPKNLLEFVLQNSGIVKRLLRGDGGGSAASDSNNGAGGDSGEDNEGEDEEDTQASSSATGTTANTYGDVVRVPSVTPEQFWEAFRKVCEEVGGEWKGGDKGKEMVERVWAFGPHEAGGCLLVDARKEGRVSLKKRLERIRSGEPETEEGKDRIFRDFENHIETAFQLATFQGPLCGEPVEGMAYFVESVEVNQEALAKEIEQNRLAQVMGSIISGVRDACRNGLLDWSPRLMLAMYTCDIQASTDVLGKVYAVVAKRRGKIVAEEMKEGTSLFNVTALLPVVESFGFADDIRKRTSGAASPQLVFSGYDLLDLDPFWVPTTEEELEDLGEKADRVNIAKVYMDGVRERKGLFVDRKIVEFAEKQRTLKRPMAVVATQMYNDHHQSFLAQPMRATTSNHLSPVQQQQSALQQQAQDVETLDDQYQTIFCRALYDYDAQDSSALSFRRGDIIEVLTQQPSGWWDGLLGDERGWFPSNYVEVISDEEAEAAFQAADSSGGEGANSENDHGMVDMSLAMMSAGGSQSAGEDWSDTEGSQRDGMTQSFGQGPASVDFWMPEVTPGGQIYYVNTQTGQQSRYLPQEAEDDVSDSDYAGLASQTSSRSGTSAGLAFGLNTQEIPGNMQDIAGFGIPRRTGTPEPWVRKLSDDGVGYYYYNKHDGRVQMNRPESTNNGLSTQKTPSQASLRQPGPNSQANGNRRQSAYSDDSDVAPLEHLPPRRAKDFASRGQERQAHPAHQEKDQLVAERIARTLQHSLIPPQPRMLTELSTSTRSAIHAVINNVKSSGFSRRPDEDNRMDGLIHDVVLVVRNLLYVTTVLTGQIPNKVLPPEIRDSQAPTTSSPLKTTQRKVTATLSRLVLSARAIQYNSGAPIADILQRIEIDAEELEKAVQSFTLEVQRYQNSDHKPFKRLHGVFGTANLGPGLLGAGAAGRWKGFGWVALDETQATSRRVLGPEVIAELKLYLERLDDQFQMLNKCMEIPDEQSVNQVRLCGRGLVSHLMALLIFVSDIHIARHVDIDGFRQEGVPISEAYEQTVDSARLLVRTLETVVQTTFDDSATFLMTLQSVPDSEQIQYQQERGYAYDHLDALSSALSSNIGLILRTLDSLLSLGHEQAEMAQGEYNGSIEWRMSLVSVQPISDFANGRDGHPEVVDMVDAFSKRPRGKNNDYDYSTYQMNNSEMSHTLTEASHADSVDGTTLEDTLGPEPGVGDEDNADPARQNKPSGSKKVLAKLLGDEYKERVATDEKPWFLRPNYDPSEILIDPDNSVRGGTLPALVERLTAHDQADRAYNQAFLMTFKSFTTVDELFELLVSRFEIQPPPNLKPNEIKDWVKLKQQVVQMRVINTLKSMITDDDILEKEDQHILPRIEEFARSETASHLSAAKQLLVHIDRARGDSVKKTTLSQVPAPPPIIPKANRKLKLADMDALELARQLTMMESNLYMKIKPMECLQRAREQKTENLDNIASVIQTSNRIADWVADTVLSKEDSRKRAAAVKQLITVADRCRTMNNFSTMIAITSGLNTPPIRRLKRTWEQVNQRTMAQFAACEMTIDSNKTFTKYRQLMASVTPPCVPFIGVFLSTLQFIQDGNPDMLPGGLVNFRKRQKASEVISDIKRWQAQPFNFTIVPIIQQYIEESLGQFNDTKASSDHFWALSLEREPREREDEKMARLLQESGFL